MSQNLPAIPKLMSLKQAVERRETLRDTGKTVGLTNGCFDILHAGHLYFLNEAAKNADTLWVALNSDSSVKCLKGDSRPIQNQWERAYALSSLESVKGILIFDTPHLADEIKSFKPDIYMKAGDYDLGTINHEEHEALVTVGSEIRFLEFLKGFSTTSLLEKLQTP